MGTFSSVDCQEVHGSMSENFDITSGVSASVVLNCAWGDRYALMNDLLATPRAWPKTTGLTPYAVSCACTPLESSYTTSGQECVYNIAQVRVNYNTTITDVASETIEPNMEAIPLDFTKFRWSDKKPLLEGEAPPLILRSLNLIRTRYRLAALPTETLTCIGMVNDATYTSALLGLGFTAETLLFLPAPANRTFTTLTSNGFTASLKFSFRPQGWNKYWRTETQAWESIYLQGSGTPYKSYPTASFAGLLA